MFTTFQIGEKLLPDKFATEDELRRLISRYSTNGRATTAADLVLGKLGVWKFSMRLAAHVAAVSFGYVNTACYLSEADCREVESGSRTVADFHRVRTQSISDESIVRFINKVEDDRLAVLLASRCSRAA